MTYMRTFDSYRDMINHKFELVVCYRNGQLFLLMLLSFPLIWSCRPSNSGDSGDTIVEYQPLEDYLGNYVVTLVGTIDNIPITANLVSHDSKIYGGYLYNSFGQTLNLTGDYDSAGKCRLVEKNEKGLVTGIFEGGFTKDGLFKGTWENPEGTKKLSFVFQKQEFNGNYFGSDSTYFEDCSGNEFEDEDGYFDHCDSCIIVSLKYDSINTANDALDAVINTELRHHLGLNSTSTFNGYPKHRINSDNDRPYTETVYLDAISRSKYGYSFSMSFDYYACGGASPDIGYEFYNFDLKSGNIIELEDIFKPDYASRLVAIYNAFYGASSEDEYWGIDLEALSFVDFLLVENGLILIQRDDLSGEYYQTYFIDFCSLSEILK